MPVQERDWLFRPTGGARMAQLASDQFVLAPIRRAVCKRFDVTEEELDGYRRAARIVEARHIAFYLAVKMTGMSLPRIGRVFGFKDHTSIMHGRDRIAWQAEHMPGVKAILYELADEVRKAM